MKCCHTELLLISKMYFQLSFLQLNSNKISLNSLYNLLTQLLFANRYLAMWYPVDNIKSFEQDVKSNKNISDIIAENPTTTKNLPIKEGIKEKMKIVEDDVIAVKAWYYINDDLTREESEERINTLLIFATLPSSLVLLCFLLKILLVLSADNLHLLILGSEGK